MELVNSTQASKVIQELLAAFRSKQWPVIHIQHIATRPGATFFLPGTLGAEIHDAVKPVSGEPVIIRHFPNSFQQTELQQQLQAKGIKKLIIVGMMTHMCIDTTVRAAFELGYECVVVGEACATKSLSFAGQTVAPEQVQYAFLAALNGVFSNVITKEDALSCIIG